MRISVTVASELVNDHYLSIRLMAVKIENSSSFSTKTAYIESSLVQS